MLSGKWGGSATNRPETYENDPESQSLLIFLFQDAVTFLISFQQLLSPLELVKEGLHLLQSKELPLKRLHGFSDFGWCWAVTEVLFCHPEECWNCVFLWHVDSAWSSMKRVHYLVNFHEQKSSTLRKLLKSPMLVLLLKVEPPSSIILFIVSESLVLPAPLLPRKLCGFSEIFLHPKDSVFLRGEVLEM